MFLYINYFNLELFDVLNINYWENWAYFGRLKSLAIYSLEKTEKHQENEVNDEEFNWNNVKRGNLKYW
jgi:hypothetical protein